MNNRKFEIYSGIVGMLGFMVGFMYAPWIWLSALFLGGIVQSVLFACMGTDYLYVWTKPSGWVHSKKYFASRGYFVSGAVTWSIMYMLLLLVTIWFKSLNVTIPVVVNPEGEQCMVFDGETQMSCHEYENANNIRVVEMPAWLNDGFKLGEFRDGQYVTFDVEGVECAVMELKKDSGWYDPEVYCGGMWTGDVVNTLDVIDYIKKGGNNAGN